MASVELEVMKKKDQGRKGRELVNCGGQAG